jgi:predicted negative regulator of RcsB-dependent stress response
VKLRVYIGIVLMAVMVVGCNTPPDSPAALRHPLLEGEGLAHKALDGIDSLMWKEPDSALKVMMEFAGSPEAESLNEFEGHYCQVLVAELLFKNDYGQSNREEVLKAVGYFDSLVDIHGADTRGVSLPFIDARAHYINGAGYYERDSVVAACGEYLKALEIVETHFPGIETRHGTSLQPNHLPRFMALTYGRLGDLFSGQFMQEPAIVCYKNSLVFSKIEPTSANGIANLMSHLGNQYSILQQMDSAGYYFNEAFKYLADTNNLAYRDLISGLALYNYYSGKSVESAVSDLKRMATQTKDENERLTRFFTIGSIYFEIRQFDSAMVYLTRVFENKDNVVMKRGAARSLRDIFQVKGDTLKATQYARYQVENPALEAESNRQVSQLNELFQQHLQWEQERAEAERQQAARQRRNRMIVVVSVLVVVAALLAWLLIRRKMKQQRDAASQQMEAVQEAHRLEKASMSGRLKRSNQELRELKDQMRQRAGNGAPKQEAQAVSFNDEPICRLIMERVNEGQFKAQMDCKLYLDYALGKEQVMALREAADRHFNQFTVRLAKAYPNLTKGDLDYCCLYLLGLSDADISALMQRAYATVSERSRKIKTIFGTEEPLSVALMSFANESVSI